MGSRISESGLHSECSVIERESVLLFFDLFHRSSFMTKTAVELNFGITYNKAFRRRNYSKIVQSIDWYLFDWSSSGLAEVQNLNSRV